MSEEDEDKIHYTAIESAGVRGSVTPQDPSYPIEARYADANCETVFWRKKQWNNWSAWICIAIDDGMFKTMPLPDMIEPFDAKWNPGGTFIDRVVKAVTGKRKND